MINSYRVRSNLSIKKYGYDVRKSNIQHVYDFLFFPLRCILPYRWLQYLKLTDLGRERRCSAIPYLSGRILDIGCGPLNELKNEYKFPKNILNADIFQWGNVEVLCFGEYLPFKNERFDTVLMLACLNHIKNQQLAIEESYRVLKPEGRIIISMINPLIGFLVHSLVFWFDYDRDRKWIKRNPQD
ncbi:MAG: class I SAM-dependent methyltransferase [Nitrospirota bacterium]